jgi:PAS domain S-box-containing protein
MLYRHHPADSCLTRSNKNLNIEKNTPMPYSYPVFTFLSLILQCAAAYYSFRLINLTGRTKAWWLLSLAIGTMAGRRFITLVTLMSAPAVHHLVDYPFEIIGVFSSFLLLMAVLSFKPFFSKIRDSKEEQRALAENLEKQVQARTRNLQDTMDNLRQEVEERQRAEAAISSSHAEMTQILNTANDGMCIIDHGFKVVRTNETFRTLVQRPDMDLVGRKCYEIFPGDTCHTANCPMILIRNGEQRVESEVIKQGADGSEVTCILTATPFRNPDGELIGIIEAFHDISQRKQIEKEIEDQRNTLLVEQKKQRALLDQVENAKRQWEATMDRVDDMVIMADAEMRVQRCNKPVLTFSGGTFAEILRQRIPDLFAGMASSELNEDGKPFSYFHAESGRWFTVALYRTNLGNDGEGLVMTLHDITEMKRITAELEKKNQDISNTSQELQRAIDEISGLIQRVVTEENFGTYFTYDFPRSCYEVKQCHNKDCSCYGKKGCRCWQEAGTFCGGVMQGEFAKKYNSCAECNYFQIITANPINLIGEQFNNMMHILEGKNNDLQSAYSELKQTQSHLLQQEKMASIGQLAAGVAHEINNPMGFISSNLTSLQKYSSRLVEYIALEEELVSQSGSQELADRQTDSKKKYKIDYILSDINGLIRESLEGCDRVKKIVQNLKSFSRVDQATRQNVDIHECLDSTINIVWNELKYKAKIVKDYRASTTITCFPQQLNQVFMNLLVNAAHAIETEGVITIKTWQNEASLSIAISDTGCGIEPENVGRIFEPFFTTKAVGKGTGLGLSIVYDIITKNHHGDIVVESKLGQGTTFVVKIPFEGN